ncbi:MAG TPA: sugar transferase [Bryobacteraceae bacterium]|nr:sugar transferase [Bryobacteraceae bacterium]
MPASEAVRRTVEFAAAILIGIALLPLMAAVSAVIFLSMGPPVIFRHPRAGYRRQPFTLYKFRTMSDETGPDGRLLPDSERLTRIGRFLRKTSLDELPQLWNVLRGDMSFVGPRPLALAYLPRYTAQQQRRHQVRPGITGWAQVQGRNALSWEEKFDRDIWYVDHRGLWLDFRIVGLTLLAIARRQGISQAGHATMPEFMGSMHER